MLKTYVNVETFNFDSSITLIVLSVLSSSYFLLFSMLKTVELLNIFCGNCVIFSGFFDE